MLRPLQDKVLVCMDESLPNQAGLILKPDTSKWRAKDGAIEGWNRGTVISTGPGKRHPKSGVLLPVTVQPGDVVRFSELEYPTERVDGREYVLIGEGDIMFVEEPECL